MTDVSYVSTHLRVVGAPPDSIPAPYHDLVLLNPLMHMGFRQGFCLQYRAIGLDMEYLSGFAFLTLFAGMLVFTLSRKTLRNE